MKHDALNTGGPAPPDVHVMQAKIEMLFTTFQEVKSVLKSIEETVSILKVFDLQLKQMGGDLARLEDDVRMYSNKLEDIEAEIEAAVKESEDRLQQQVTAAKTTAEDTKNALQSKVSYVQGAVATVALLGALLYAVAIWWGSRVLDTTEDNERYINILKTLEAEQHLRGAMNKPYHYEIPERGIAGPSSGSPGASQSKQSE